MMYGALTLYGKCYWDTVQNKLRKVPDLPKELLMLENIYRFTFAYYQ